MWNINNFECLFYIDNYNNNYDLLSACFLNHITGNYIVSIYNNLSYIRKDSIIKIYNFNKLLTKTIILNENTFFISSYYDNRESKSYILTGNRGCVTSYDFNTSLIYHKYQEYEHYNMHKNIFINDYEETIKLIESSDVYIRIWNFHSAEILMKIYINNTQSICLWNIDYLFVGGNKKIILIHLKYGIVVDEIYGHNKVISIQKLIHPKFGECLVSQGGETDFIFIRKIN